MSLNQTNEILDVVIIGGGLVGGLTALLLAQGGVQPTVLDAAPILDADKTLRVANPRVLALSQATIHLLKTVGVWENLVRQQPYTGMQVWNKNGYGEINFGQSSEKTPSVEQALGSMVEPSILNLAIQQKMLEDVQDYRTQVKVSRIERGVGVWIIHLADGTQLQTKLVIGADGANSFVREQAFIDIDVLDYKQAGISCANIWHVRFFWKLALWLFYLWPALIRKSRDTGNRLSGLCQRIMPKNMQRCQMLSLPSY